MWILHWLGYRISALAPGRSTHLSLIMVGFVLSWKCTEVSPSSLRCSVLHSTAEGSLEPGGMALSTPTQAILAAPMQPKPIYSQYGYTPQYTWCETHPTISLPPIFNRTIFWQRIPPKIPLIFLFNLFSFGWIKPDKMPRDFKTDCCQKIFLCLCLTPLQPSLGRWIHSLLPGNIPVWLVALLLLSVPDLWGLPHSQGLFPSEKHSKGFASLQVLMYKLFYNAESQLFTLFYSG